MARMAQPGFSVDWGSWASQDRTPLQKVALSADKGAEVAAAAAKEGHSERPVSPCQSMVW